MRKKDEIETETFATGGAVQIASYANVTIEDSYFGFNQALAGELSFPPLFRTEMTFLLCIKLQPLRRLLLGLRWESMQQCMCN